MRWALTLLGLLACDPIVVVDVPCGVADSADEDTDDDGLSDGDEVNIYGTDPKDTDTDDDRLLDGDEVNIYGTDPNDADTDDGGLEDGDEVYREKDPLDGSDD